MKERICLAIAKLKATTLYTDSTYLYFNAYLIKSVFFGTGIMHLILKQNKELKVICEEAICTKLGLRSKFPRAILYSNKSSIGIELIAPETSIAMLTIKLYIGNKRAQTKVG